ncbi:Rab family GTPase [Seonamhaeicola marinus]|uniref:GTP-binding protein n=1 Tax=Seonamhaeicola marinus TaxID=1912246 RepID=A0A5D0IUN3_9FLAO|nr:GTP-binding protein [Seonamhaeicola marinus]TYA86749.1 GTP-binding protein [Seonamhaeicola marinus]
MITSKKIVLLGHFGVGKSSIVRQFITNEFSTDYKVTIGVHILKKEISLKSGGICSLIIWDLEGTDNIDLVNTSYLLGTDSFIYVYDVTRPITYVNLEENVNKLKLMFSNSLIKVVGNKVDLFDAEEREAYEKLMGSKQYLGSAKTGENINTIFLDIAKELILEE